MRAIRIALKLGEWALRRVTALSGPADLMKRPMAPLWFYRTAMSTALISTFTHGLLTIDIDFGI